MYKQESDGVTTWGWLPSGVGVWFVVSSCVTYSPLHLALNLLLTGQPQ